ncbi:UNVERIFIED_CONTAM: hypothetical protein Scaly_1577800 [Sesamum calycinum]|uniref:Glycoside hydrolase 123 catalytic domain-containing protein n=1 Tax=Sesamum calycinum TaxID=2727403 RepID=A0AAW2PAZ5_9LAMI
MENSGSHPEVMVPPVEGVAGGGTAYGWSESGIQDPNLLRGSIDPLKVHSSELVHVWCMPNSANVGPQDMPRPLEPISLLAARNERENVQIALRPKVSWAGSSIAGSVHVQCSDLCSTSGDRLVVGESVKMRRVVPILGVPDALVPLELPLSQLTLYPGETTVIWVSIDVPTTQPPGQYEGEVIITAIRADAESTAQCLGKAERNQLYQELKSCLDVVEPIDGKSLDVVVGSIVNLTPSPVFAFHPEFEFVSDASVGESMRVLTYTCPWPGPSDAPLASNNFEAFLKVPEFLRPHTQIYCTSEWVIGNRRSGKGYHSRNKPENVSQVGSGVVHKVSFRVLFSYAAHAYPALLKGKGRVGASIWVTPIQNRVIGTLQEGGTGFLYWGANCYEKAMVPSAEIRFRRGLPPGDGVLYYPGQVFSSSQEPVASLRLERLLSGLQDIEYLKLYSSRFGREEGLHLLEKTGMYLGPERYTHEHMPIDAMRGEVFRTCRAESNF